MANRQYNKYKNRKLGSGTQSLADWDTDTIKAALVTAAYSPDTSDSGHEFFTDLTGVIGTVTLSGLSISGGAVIPGGTVTFVSVTGTGTKVVLYKDTGSGATSPLLVLIDTFTSGMPVTGSGTNIDLSFNIAGILQT